MPATIELEEGIPLPVSYSLYPQIETIRQLAVGDSFFVACDKPVAVLSLPLIAGKLGYKFHARAVIKGGQLGFRVWRRE